MLELAGLNVVVVYHLIDACDVRFKVIFGVSDPGIPLHRKEAFDVSLCNLGVSAHIKIDSVVVSSQYVCLHALNAFIFM